MSELYEKKKCSCGCEVEFFGIIPATHNCFMCGAALKEKKEKKKLNKISEAEKIMLEQ